MNIKRFPWAWLLALIVGFGLGLTYAWIISPVKFVDAEPQLLRDNFKDQFRSTIAAAYASNPDLGRARARLALLGDPDPSQALSAQAQRMLAAGETSESIQQVALLASALQGQAAVVPSVTETVPPSATDFAASPPAETFTASVDTGEPGNIETTNNTPTSVQLTATPRPTRTPTPTLGAPYQLIGQDTVCDSGLAEGLLQVTVTNISRQQVPGAEIIITWNGGEEHIFTGFKPELGNGYADFLMTPGVVYSVRMADGGTSASEVSAPECTATDGSPYPGGVRISFQKP